MSVFGETYTTGKKNYSDKSHLCRRHGHPVQNGEIFFVSKSVGEVISKKILEP